MVSSDLSRLARVLLALFLVLSVFDRFGQDAILRIHEVSIDPTTHHPGRVGKRKGKKNSDIRT